MPLPQTYICGGPMRGRHFLRFSAELQTNAVHIKIRTDNEIYEFRTESTKAESQERMYQVQIYD